MRLADLDIGVLWHRSTFSGDYRELNWLCRPVVEAFRYELARRPTVDDAPFRKLLVRLISAAHGPDKGLPELLIDVFAASVPVKEADLLGDIARKDEALLDAVSAGFAIAKRELGWSHPAVAETIASLRGRHPMGWIELDHLQRRDRKSGRQFRVVYDVQEGSAAILVLVSDADGAEVRRERVADLSHTLIEWAFPVRSAIIDAGAFVLRDRVRRPLASVSVDD